MPLRLLCLIFVRVCGWLVLLGRSTLSKDIELLVRNVASSPGRDSVAGRSVGGQHFTCRCLSR